MAEESAEDCECMGTGCLREVDGEAILCPKHRDLWKRWVAGWKEAEAQGWEAADVECAPLYTQFPDVELVYIAASVVLWPESATVMPTGDQVELRGPSPAFLPVFFSAEDAHAAYPGADVVELRVMKPGAVAAPGGIIGEG